MRTSWLQEIRPGLRRVRIRVNPLVGFRSEFCLSIISFRESIRQREEPLGRGQTSSFLNRVPMILKNSRQGRTDKFLQGIKPILYIGLREKSTLLFLFIVYPFIRNGCFYFSPKIVRASSTVAISKSSSRAILTAFSTSCALLFASSPWDI